MDDTDSPSGGCTTHVLTDLIDLARTSGLDLIGEPRLVRLNPNVPWKTRGNAALSARFGAGVGPRRAVGEIERRTVWSYARSRVPDVTAVRAFERAAWDRVLRGSRSGEEGTDPALVVAPRHLPAALYWKAVREVVPVAEARANLERAGASWWTESSDRGLVGAAAAVAWPGRHPTWELTSYRDPARLGSPREIDGESVRRVARETASLFLCDDPRTRRLLVAPHTSCPILFGLRGTRPADLLRARGRVRSEPVDRWVLFRTNQGTGDHLVRRRAAGLGPFLSARVVGTVARPPTTLRGGHVRFVVTDDEGTELECVAFEPTKTLPRVARTLVAGDRVEVWGGRGDTTTFRLEGLRILRLRPRHARPIAPACPGCGRRAGSLGAGRGYRCPGCRRRWPPEAAVRERERPVYPVGEYHPTPSARRHLAPRGPEP